MSFTKLVSVDQATSQSVIDWIDTQLDLEAEHSDTWANPLPRNQDTKCFIKKHPTIDMTGYPTQSHFNNEDWDDTWAIPSEEE